MPYVGIQSKYGSESSLLTLRVIGLPYAPGSVIWNIQGPGTSTSSDQTFEDGYFVEGALEYVCKPFDGACIGGFARYNAIHATSVDFYSNDGAPPDPDDLLGFGLTRQTWTLGATFSVLFDLGGLF